MSSYKVSINVANSNNYAFTSTRPGDLVFKNQTPNTAVFFGTQSNINAVIKDNIGYLKSQYVGIAGKSNAEYALDVLGDINLSGDLLKNGEFFQTSQWTNSGSNIVLMNSNVGIGKSNPSYSLEVVGGIANFTQAVYVNGAPIAGVEPAISNMVYSSYNRAFNGSLLKSGGTINGTVSVTSVNVVDSLKINNINASNLFAPLSTSNVSVFSSNTAYINNSYYLTTSNAAYTSSNRAFNNLSLSGGVLTGNLTGTTINATTLRQGGVNIGDLLAPIGVSNIAYGALSKTGGTITGNLEVYGDLTASGTITNIDVTSLDVQDSILTLNKNQTGTPASILQSGIEIERGSASNYLFAFDEATSLFKIGTEDQLQAVTTRVDNLATGYPYYDQTTAKLTTRVITTTDVSTLDSSLTGYSNTIHTASNTEYNNSGVDASITVDTSNATILPGSTQWSFIYHTPSSSNFFLRSSFGSVDNGKQKFITNIGNSNVFVNITSSNGSTILANYTLPASSNMYFGWYENSWYRLA